IRRWRSATAPTTPPCCSPPDLASPIAPSPSSPHRRTRASTTAISPRCFICRATGARSSRRRNLLERDCDPAGVAVRRGDQEQHGPAAVLLGLIDALLQVGRIADRLLRHLDDDIARGEPALGGSRAGVDPGDDHALDGVLDLEALAQIVGEIGDVKPEHALDRGLLLGRLLTLGERRLFLALLQPPDLDGPRLFFSLADDDDLDLLAHRRVGNDARQVAPFLDLAPVEFDDHVAGLDAARLRRPLVVDPGNERAARRLHAEALGNLVVHLLDAHAEPAAASLAVFAQLLDHRQRGLRRHRETDADRSAGGRDDRGIYADDFAIEIEQRTARVAAVDRGVGL